PLTAQVMVDPDIELIRLDPVRYRVDISPGRGDQRTRVGNRKLRIAQNAGGYRAPPARRNDSVRKWRTRSRIHRHHLQGRSEAAGGFAKLPCSRASVGTVA